MEKEEVEVVEEPGRIELIGDHAAPADSQAVEELEGLPEEEAAAALEALLLANGEPLSIGRLKEVTKLSEEQIRDALESVKMVHESDESGFELVEVGGQFQFRTKAKFAPYIQALKAGRPRKHSQAALETLAIVAYRQPIVKSDIEKIRGVDATPTIKTLLDRKLIRIVGHKAAVGQPALYGTGEEFLKLFGLTSLSELPTLRDIKELESDPGETESETQSGGDAREDEPEAQQELSLAAALSEAAESAPVDAA